MRPGLNDDYIAVGKCITMHFWVVAILGDLYTLHNTLRRMLRVARLLEQMSMSKEKPLFKSKLQYNCCGFTQQQPIIFIVIYLPRGKYESKKTLPMMNYNIWSISLTKPNEFNYIPHCYLIKPWHWLGCVSSERR